MERNRELTVAAHHRICRSTAPRSPVLTRVGIILRSANRHLLAVPRFRLNTYGRREFSVAGPMAWNSLPEFYSGIQRATQTVLGIDLERTCSRVTSASSALGVLNDYALYKSTVIIEMTSNKFLHSHLLAFPYSQ